MNSKVEQYIKVHSKSYTLGFLLTLFLGPLGLFYCSWIAGLILLAIAVVTASTIIVPIVCWVLSMSISFIAVGKHNDKIKATAELSLVSDSN
ncbi:hypothetical protein DS2_00055 [Catenovulum agarivorans DS-2]|uniref:Uncharacterized protein n=1 Tax=Catenovulum agarivorans DS-2 TaxID=1328313 RepID=W7QGM1_9ALTE|nr:hypothetical protein [Catenovulum agarivorans]EWH12069.1 hypothetical protein DS2_00055 [Catenovulum agarivorans DS-2]